MPTQSRDNESDLLPESQNENVAAKETIASVQLILFFFLLYGMGTVKTFPFPVSSERKFTNTERHRTVCHHQLPPLALFASGPS
jgi:hypothetical protein